MKLPKTPGAVADALYDQRAARLSLEKKVDDLKSNETALKDHLFKLLPKLDATSISGKRATVSIERQAVPDLDDWDSLLKYMKKNNAFDLINHAVNTKAWRERLEAKEVVPGVKTFIRYKVHCSKKGKS